MTLHVQTTSYVPMGAYVLADGRMSLTVGVGNAQLTVEDATKLRDYLDKFIQSAEQEKTNG